VTVEPNKLRMTRDDWERIGEEKGWLDSEDIAFNKQDLSILLSKLYGKGLAGRMAINMLRSQPQKDAIFAILDVMGQNWSYWRNVLQTWDEKP
jgi:hypothetical protein